VTATRLPASSGDPPDPRSAPRRTADPDLDPAVEAAGALARLRRRILAAVVFAFAAAMAVLVLAVLTRTIPLGVEGGVLAVGGLVCALLAARMLDNALDDIRQVTHAHERLFDLYGRARRDALVDGLTGLGNHRAFHEELGRAIALSRRASQPVALLMLDVDHLKRANDTRGHEAGDELLRGLAQVIEASLRRGDRAFRVGGDEFAILCPSTPPQGAANLARRILAASLARDENGGEFAAISFTCGISGFPVPSASRRELLAHADAALYWGKAHGRTDIEVYEPTIHGSGQEVRTPVELKDLLGRVIDEELLTPVFQPVHSLVTGEVLGFEGLVRPKAGSGFDGPGFMFAAAETADRVVELDFAAIRAIAQGARNLDRSRYLAVNLSPRTLEAAAFSPHEVMSILRNAGVEPTRLVVEITEREEIRDVDSLRRSVDALRRWGVRIAADDVGAGNAGLRLLAQIDFDLLKIDLSLVQNGARSAPSLAVLRALQDLAASRGATAVAEGVETRQQLTMLRELGVGVGQGYLLGRPRPSIEAVAVDLDALGRPGGPALTRLAS
jgi:diguanylate cyclase (GGDEF)-like protein